VVLGGGNGVVVARGCSRGKRFQNLSQPMDRSPFVFTGRFTANAAGHAFWNYKKVHLVLLSSRQTDVIFVFRRKSTLILEF
jgi:hypothetical protein